MVEKRDTVTAGEMAVRIQEQLKGLEEDSIVLASVSGMGENKARV